MNHLSRAWGRLHTLVITGCLVAAAQSANAAIITLSTHSSDETDPALLDATLEFEVLGNVLTLTVTNDTIDPFEYFMNRVFFNATDAVSDFTPMFMPDGWELSFDEHADSFGVFDFGLIGGVGEDDENISAGESLEFTFSFTGSATDLDFVSMFSTIPPGDNPAIAAAKFVAGPDGDSGYGGYIPAPGAAALLLIAGLGTRRRRRV